MKTRLLCILLVVVLCVGMLPVGALAASEEPDADALTEETVEETTEEPTEETVSAEETVEETEEDPTEELSDDTVSIAEAILPDDEITYETEEAELLPSLDGGSDGTAATSGTCGDNLTWTLADGVLTISGTGKMEDYANGGNVPWYSLRDTVTQIVIEDGVTSIGECAFYGCDSLASITIPDGVTSIGDSAFYGCKSLTDIIIPGNVTVIGNDAFCLCESLEHVTIQNGVTTIGEDAFEFCSALTSIAIPDSVTSIGDGAFYYCESLESVALPDGVTSIGSSAFYECSSLTSVALPDGMTSIGEKAFYWCSSLTSIAIPDSVTSIEDWTFSGCTSLASVTIPYGVTSIGFCAFSDCGSLTSITLPDGVTSIESYAFDGCSGLTEVTIPESVTSIGNHAFNGCSKLLDVKYGGSTEQWGAIKISDDNARLTSAFINGVASGSCGDGVTWELIKENGCFTISGSGDIEKYMYDYNIPWYSHKGYITSVLIENGVTSIVSSAFACCSNLVSVIIPGSVTSIGGRAFYSCRSLVSATISDGITSIGNYAFYGCESLETITIPDSTTGIGSCAFYDCTSLTSVTIGIGLKRVLDSAFSCCSALTSVTYAGTEEDWNAIDIGSGNYNLTNAYLSGLNSGSCGDNLTWSLENGTLTISGTGKMTDYSESNTSPWHRKCDTITSVIIGDGITSIGSYAFYECESLAKVTIPESVTSIGESAFIGCNKLKSITYAGDSWDAIKIGTGNTRLTYLYDRTYTTKYDGFAASGICGDDLVWTLTKAGSLSISGTGDMEDYSYIYDERPPWAYKSITAVSIGDGVTSIGNSAFENCEKLTSVTIGGDVESIGEYAFSWCTKLTSLTLPASLTSVGGNAFEFSTKLTSFTVDPNNTAYTAVNGVLFSKDMATLICCPGGYSGAYTIPTGVVTIGDSAFSGGNGITSVVIPDGVTTIEDYAFGNHSSLASITIPASVEKIGQGAFARCTSLTNVTYTGTKEEWDAILVRDYNTPLFSAFINGEASGTCGNNLTWTLTSTGVLTISGTGEMKINAENAPWYAHRSSITTVVIKEGVTSVGISAFYNCTALKSVTLAGSVASIKESAFTDCKSLTNITIPDGVTSIEERAFLGCTSLAAITIPDSVTSIGSEAFYSCSALTDVYYTGEEDQWKAISIGSSNTRLTKATLHCFMTAEKIVMTLEDVDTTSSPEAIRDAVQDIGAENLAKALEGEDSGVLEKLGKLEASVKGSVITVTTNSTVESVKSASVTVTGAALNDLAEDNTEKTITLKVDPVDSTETALPDDLASEGAVYLDITLEGVANPHQLEVPVVLTLAVPEGMDASLLRIVHYKENAAGEVVGTDVLEPTVFQDEDGQWYARFVVTGFSTFVLAQLARILGDFNGDGQVTILDVLALLKHVAGISTLNGNLDVNKDNAVTILDVLHLLKFVARIITSL